MPKRDCKLQPRAGASRLVGDPVDVVTGAVIDQDTEFELPGAPLPLRWTRYYDSRHADSDRGLGRGFRHELDHTLCFDVDGMTYSDPTWSVTTFPFLAEDGDSVRASGVELERVDAMNYRVGLAGGRTLEFSFPGQAHVGRLQLIEEHDQSLALHYDGRSLQLQAVGLGELGRLRLEWVDGHIARVVWVERDAETDTESEKTLARYHYDAQGCLSEAQNPHKHKLKYAFDAAQRLVRKTNAQGYSFVYVYDEDGRCIESRGEDGAERVQLEYRPTERTTIVTRHDGGKWTYQYTDFGAIAHVLDPCGGAQAFTFDDQGRVIEEIDPLGNVTHVLYDANNQPVAKLDPWGHREPIDEDAPDVHPLDHRTPDTALEIMFGTLFFAPARLPATGDTLWNVPWQARQALQTADPAWGGDVERDYSPLGTPLHDRNEAGKRRRWTYDENGFLRWVQDFDGGKRSFEYTSDSHLAREIDENGGVTQFEHSPTEELTALVDPGGTRSEYKLDQKDRVVEVHRHGKLRERYVYDLADNLIEKRDGRGQLLFQCTIGAGNVNLARTLSDGEMQTFDYDRQGRLIEAVSAAGRCELSYASGGQLASDLRDGQGVVHADDTTIVLGKFVTRYRRTSIDELRWTDPTGASHGLQRIGPGIIDREHANGVREVSQFDVEGRCLAKTLYRKRDDDRPWVRSFHFSGEGDLLECRDNERGATRYRYDPGHRLRDVLHPNGRADSYELDLADNLLRTPSPLFEARALDTAQRFELRDGNRLQRVGSERFEYDDRDNIVLRESWSGATRYVRNSLDQLISASGPGYELTAAYDALGRRTHKTVNGQTTTYYWDGDRLAAEIRPGGALRVYIYVAPLAMVPVMWIDYASVEAAPDSGLRRYVVTDHLGSVHTVLDDAGETLWSARLDPYGLAQIDVGARVHQPLRFPGHFHDAETGLHYNRFRYYDPALCRYLESDPQGIEGGRNLYAYTTNPLSEVDLLGLASSGRCKKCEPKATKKKQKADGKKKESNKDKKPAQLPKKKAKLKPEVSDAAGAELSDGTPMPPGTKRLVYTDGKHKATYYVDAQGRTLRAELPLKPPAKFKKEGVGGITPKGFKSGRDDRGHLAPERGAPKKRLVNREENVIAEHGKKSNRSKKRAWENRAVKEADKNPGSSFTTVHEPVYEGKNPRPTEVKHMLQKDGTTDPKFTQTIPNPNR